MNPPLAISIKYLLGIYALSPFEHALLQRLSDALGPPDREVLAFQLAHFTTLGRMLKHYDEPGAHGFTKFLTLRFGRNVVNERQTKRFSTNEHEAVLASTRVTFDGGEMSVQYCLVAGVLFSLEYRSPQQIYYPPGVYAIEPVVLWPTLPPVQS